MSKSAGLPAVLVLACSVGCGSSTQSFVAEGLKEKAKSSPSLLLMAPDVQLFELTAGGVLEPKADWTEQAEKHVAKSLVEQLRERKLNLVAYEPAPPGSAREHADLQLLRLHDAVLSSILVHHYNPNARLPAKRGKFDWTLGPGVRRLRGDKKADYVLLVWLRDSYATGGRTALVALSSIFSPITGYAASGGQQAGFVSLVDLETGDVVWCNALYRKSGDLRTEEPARQVVRYLLEDFPL